MNSVVLVRLSERGLEVTAVPFEAPVGQAVGPGNQRRPMRAVADRIERIGVEHRPIADEVLPNPAADLDNRRRLLTVSDFVLLA